MCRVTDRQTPLVVLTTLATADAARALVRRLVEDRVVACGTVVPGSTSIYRWQGAVTADEEALVLLKTVGDRWDALVAAIERLHPYDVPELLALPVTAGLPSYLSWLDAETAEAAA
jgi:periplasmic divalent cation tolerance protein